MLFYKDYNIPNQLKGLIDLILNFNIKNKYIVIIFLYV